jgi:hypothetical protein
MRYSAAPLTGNPMDSVMLGRRQEMQKAARRRADNLAAMPQRDAAITSPVDQDEVARRAFDLYCARGCEDGHDLDDWLLAEREVQNGLNSNAA